MILSERNDCYKRLRLILPFSFFCVPTFLHLIFTPRIVRKGWEKWVGFGLYGSVRAFTCLYAGYKSGGCWKISTCSKIMKLRSFCLLYCSSVVQTPDVLIILLGQYGTDRPRGKGEMFPFHMG